MSIDMTDVVKCSDCGYVLAKDEACKESSQEFIRWYCEDCYAERQADQWNCVSREV